MAEFTLYISNKRFFMGFEQTEDGGKSSNRISVKRIDLEVPDDLKPLENWLWQDSGEY